jgi:6,7-dimethyl-8-ribityllumazine synthase
MGTTDLSSFKLSAEGLHIGILASRYNPQVMAGLLRGALEALGKLGLAEDKIEVWRVPGAFEIPLLAQKIAMRGKFDALICLATVIRGDTAHFEFVCEGVTEGLQQAMLHTEIPMAFGVLTVDTEAQAVARASSNDLNKGREAAYTAVEMALLMKRMK